MRQPFLILVITLFISSCSNSRHKGNSVPPSTARNTTVSIVKDKLYINGDPTLKGIVWRGIHMEGLLPNSRMVQGIFDDLNPATVDLWAYPDDHTWDPERNTNEFVSAMDEWRDYGLLGFTINLQGGSPQGYSENQPWYNSAIDSAGNLREDYMERLESIMDKSDDLGMVTILGIFYFGQDGRVKGEEAVKNAVRNTISWLIDKKYTNVLIEIANECNNKKYETPILKADRIDELIRLAQSYSKKLGYRFPVSASFNGNTLPTANVVKAADFILLHGNGVNHPAGIAEMVNQTRAMPEYRPMPVIFNEDDHYDFDQPDNNMTAAFRAGASWGFFDYRREGEDFSQGFQSVPVDWEISSERKKAFFDKIQEIWMGGKTSGEK